MDVFDTFMESLNPRQSEQETRDVIMAGGGCAKPEGADLIVDEAAQKVQQEPNPIHTSLENMDMLAKPSVYSFLETERSNGFEMTPNFRSFQQTGIVGDENNEENMDILDVPLECSVLETSRSNALGDECETTLNVNSVEQKEITGVENNEENMDFFLDESLEYSFLDSSRSNALEDGFETTLNVKSFVQKEINGDENNQENMNFLDQSLEYSFIETSRSNAHRDEPDTLNVKCVNQQEIMGDENFGRTSAETTIPVSVSSGLETSRSSTHRNVPEIENVAYFEQKQIMEVENFERPSAETSKPVSEFSGPETLRSDVHGDVPETSNVECAKQMEITGDENFERTLVEIFKPASELSGLETLRPDVLEDVPESPNVECVAEKEIMGDENFKGTSAETSKPASELSGLETSRSDALGDGPETPNVECVEQKEITGDENFESTLVEIFKPASELSGLETLRPDVLGDVPEIPNVECVAEKEIMGDENFKGTSAETCKPASELSGLETSRSDVLRDGPETLNVECVEQKEMIQDENIGSTSADTTAPVSELSGLETARSIPHGDVAETQNVECVERDEITVDENHERTSRLENVEDLCKDVALHSDDISLSLVQDAVASKNLSEDAVATVLTNVTDNLDIKQSVPVQTETVKIDAEVGIDKTTPVQSKKRNSTLVSPENTRVLRSKSQKKAKLPEPKAVKIEDGANETRKAKRERKKEMKNLPVNEFSRIRKHLRYLLQRINFEQSLINAYSGEGWKGQSVEKIKPEKELQRARSQIFSSKLKIRDLFQSLDASLNEGKIPETLFDSEGEIDSDDIFCAKCGDTDVTLDNDIILCDGACDRAFHQFCLDPPLLKEDIPLGDEGWLCPGCNCKDDCFDILNDFQGSRLTILDNWEKVFPEEAAAKASGKNIDDMSILQSDDSDDDDDYNPDDHPLNNVNSRKSEHISASDVRVPGQNDEGLLDLPSDDSEDDDFDPIDPPSENDQPAEHESSSSDFTSDSEDLGAILEDKDDGCVSSLSNSTKFEASADEEKPTIGEVKGQSLNNELSYLLNSDATPISGKRHVERLDYKKLHDETYGDTASDSSDDEFEEKTSRKRRKDGDDIATPKSVRCKRARKCHTDPRVGNDHQTTSEAQGPKIACGSDDKGRNTSSEAQGPKNACVKEEKSSGVGSSGNKNKKLGEAATQRLLESFNENQYPKKDVKDGLAEELGLRVQQVNKWFENARWSFRHTYRMDSKIAKISGKNVTEPSPPKSTESTPPPPPKLKPGTESTPPHKLKPATESPPPPSGNGVKETKQMQSSPEKVISEGSTLNSRCNKKKNNGNAITNQAKGVVDTQTGRRKSIRLHKRSNS